MNFYCNFVFHAFAKLFTTRNSTLLVHRVRLSVSLLINGLREGKF